MGNCHSICKERYPHREWFDTWESQDSAWEHTVHGSWFIGPDEQLLSELHSFVSPKGVSLGIVLISPSRTCKLGGSSLMVKADWPSRVTVYTDTMGTTEGTHYHRFARSTSPNVHLLSIMNTILQGGPTSTFLRNGNHYHTSFQPEKLLFRCHYCSS